jgi:hypothetical protein
MAISSGEEEIHGSPKAVARKFIAIPIMVSILVMQQMAIYSGDRFYIDREGVIRDSDEFYEPFLYSRVNDERFPNEEDRPNTIHQETSRR